MKNKKNLIVIAMLVASFALGRFSSPKSVQTLEKENVNKNVNVVETTKETRMPDGTVITEKRKEKETSTQTEKVSSKTVENRPSYRVGLIYEPAIKDFQEASYGVILEKRLFSELYVGVTVDSEKTIGLTVSLGF